MVASDEQHIRHYVLFAFQLRKNAAEAAGIISSALDESTKIDTRDLREGDSNVKNKELEKFVRHLELRDQNSVSKGKGTCRLKKSKKLICTFNPLL